MPSWSMYRHRESGTSANYSSSRSPHSPSSPHPTPSRRARRPRDCIVMPIVRPEPHKDRTVRISKWTFAVRYMLSICVTTLQVISSTASSSEHRRFSSLQTRQAQWSGCICVPLVQRSRAPSSRHVSPLDTRSMRAGRVIEIHWRTSWLSKHVEVHTGVAPRGNKTALTTDSLLPLAVMVIDVLAAKTSCVSTDSCEITTWPLG